MISEFKVLVGFWALMILLVSTILILFNRLERMFDKDKWYFSFMKYAYLAALICALVMPYIILQKYFTRVWIIQETEGGGSPTKEEMRFFGSSEYTFKNQKKVTFQTDQDTYTIIINDTNRTLESTPVFYGRASVSDRPVSISPMNVYYSSHYYTDFGSPPQTVKTRSGGQTDYWITIKY